MLTIGRVCANFISRLIRSVIVSSRSRTLETSFSSPEILNSTLQESQLKFQKQKLSYHTFAQIQSFRTLGCSNARWSLGTLYCIETFDPSNVSHPWGIETIRTSLRTWKPQAQGLEGKKRTRVRKFSQPGTFSQAYSTTSRQKLRGKTRKHWANLQFGKIKNLSK